MTTIRIVLADDHKVVREGTRRMLEHEPDLSVVGEAENGRVALQMIHDLKPDVAVLDVRMPELNGIETTKEIKKAYPQVRILIFTAHEDDRYVFPLLDAGANGYILKTAGQRDLVKAIRDVYRDETALHPSVARRVVQRLTRQNRNQSTSTVDALTERETQVLQAIAKGWSNKQVSEALCISPHTVQVHLSSVFAKLGVKSRTEAVLHAIRRGLVDVWQEGDTP